MWMREMCGNTVNLGTIAGKNESLRLPPDLRDKHLYVCGSTGTGKSKLLEYLIKQDIDVWHRDRCGLLLIDPQDSLYNTSSNGALGIASKRPFYRLISDGQIGASPITCSGSEPAIRALSSIISLIFYCTGKAHKIHLFCVHHRSLGPGFDRRSET